MNYYHLVPISWFGALKCHVNVYLFRRYGLPDHVGYVYVNYFSGYHLEEPTKFKKSQTTNHNLPSGVST